MITYPTPPWIEACTTGREPLPFPEASLGLPRQVHGCRVAVMSAPGRPHDTDAVATSTPGLRIAVKTADCIPVLLWDDRLRSVAAIHAGWRGTVQDVVGRTIAAMGSRGGDLHAIIGPGISLDAFEVGDEVYDAFAAQGFPMHEIASRQGKWHIDLWAANQWLLGRQGVTHIHVAGICTHASPHFYSARRDTISTGRNYNAIMIKP